MRSLTLALLLSSVPAALLADVIEAPSNVTAVTLFPWGAQVVREVRVEAPSGVHQLIVPDLPQGTDLSRLRVAGEGIRIGNVTLIDERPPATEETLRPEVEAARAEVDRLEAALRKGQQGVAVIRTRADAAHDRIEFLKGASTSAVAADALSAFSRAIGDEVLAARQEALQADAEADEAARGLKPAEEALEAARKTLAALEHPAQDHDLLQVTFEGTGVLRVTSYTDAASWAPAYDLRLAREEGQLVLDRYVSVSQASGEDWRGVDLTLSTARPSERSNPSDVPPRRVWMTDEKAFKPMVSGSARMAADAAPEPILAEAMEASFDGLQVNYRLGAPVDLRDGVEGLRLSLGAIAMEAEVYAEAAPLWDQTAFLVAEAQNSSGEVLLPGEVQLYVDGALAGGSYLDLVPTEGAIHQGFGAIDGLRLKRLMPETMEGDTGVLSKSNTRKEVVEMVVENMTPLDWSVRLIDRLPYSEQEDLEVQTRAVPPVSETDVDDKRGVVAWRFELPAGASKSVRSETVMTWPLDQVLR
ncbi:DUF4139 domain-containing protein [Thioclava sp. A2]|uniref:DUF4139 domain-containing protein n=1 Tax=Thioclava sp. FCG-A2 TaxID=3080562 RepID=UPI002952D95E|nr:DUF4139 domain-containing protein [Thioclava sp. A2]MDV7270368.1 DUF4139 domain-containing protein [Thioclava sp. A2]